MLSRGDHSGRNPLTPTSPSAHPDPAPQVPLTLLRFPLSNDSQSLGTFSSCPVQLSPHLEPLPHCYLDSGWSRGLTWVPQSFVEDGEGPRKKEVAECEEIEPAWHDEESAQLGLRGTKGGHSLGLRGWGQGGVGAGWN